MRRGTAAMNMSERERIFNHTVIHKMIETDGHSFTLIFSVSNTTMVACIDLEYQPGYNQPGRSRMTLLLNIFP